MKKFLLSIILFTISWINFPSLVFAVGPASPPVTTITPTPTSTLTPTPTIEPLPVNKVICDRDGTVYPPSSTCYSIPNTVEALGINLLDSSDSLISYPLSCISAPTISYKEIFVGPDPAPNNSVIYKDVDVSTDITEAQIGFLGPDTKTLETMNPDKIAQNYLFNALFDRPGADPKAAKESFRTYWRMLDSLSQAKLKAYFIEKTDDYTYYYVGEDKKQQMVKISDLKSELSGYPCLKRYGVETDNLFYDCWEKEKYLDQYTSLSKNKPDTREKYDQLLPFDFESMRAYTSSGVNVSEENIPYLRAIISGLKGYRGDIQIPIITPIGTINIPKTVIPGLFDFYTPGWANEYLAVYPTSLVGVTLTPTTEAIQYPLLKLIASFPELNSNCSASTGPSQTSAKTYPTNPITTQTVSVPVTSTNIDTIPNKCTCNYGDAYCFMYGDCRMHSSSEQDCLSSVYSCVFEEGQFVYELSGQATGKPVTVFNNPNIISLTDLVMGGKPVFTNTSGYTLDAAAKAVLNLISEKIFNPVQPSFYKMFLPDYASSSASPKKLVAASSVTTTATPADPNATVSVTGSSSINRENNLAQDTMHLLQNCWFVPSEQQSSSKCGGKIPKAQVCALSDVPLTGVCSKASFTRFATEYASTGFGPVLSTFIPNVTPELSAVYAEAEKQTGVSCVILAAVHFMEGSSQPCSSLVSGRKIGEPEPDKGGKIYNTLLETAIESGNELKRKGATGASYENVITALSNYNGGGNSNCRIDWSLPKNIGITPQYSIASGHCPPGSTRFGLYPGEDDPYASSYLGPKHEFMYLRCPRDGYCGAVIPFRRPGAFAIALNYYHSLP